MPIKVFKSTQADAPELNGNSASLITVLDAVLVNGYNSLSVTSITRVGNVATVTTPTAHGFSTGDWATIGGAVETDYNDDVPVTVLSSTTFSCPVSNSPSTPATGTITCKRSGGGFEKKYSGTEKAVYRSLRTDSNKHYLRVVDDGTGGATYKSAICYSWESMDDVDTGTTGAPTPTAQHWAKSNTADGTARWWCIVTDGRLVYMVVGADSAKAANTTAANNAFSVWGDFKSVKASDTFNVIHASCSAAYTTQSANNNFLSSVLSNSDMSASKLISVARSCLGVGGVVSNVGVQAVAGGYSESFGYRKQIAFPNVADAGFYIAPCVLYEPSLGAIRGTLPGCYESYQGPCFPNDTVIDGVAGMGSRKFLMLLARHAGNVGSVVLDITGDSSGEWW